MGLGSFLGAAGNYTDAAKAGLDYGRYVVNSQRDQEAKNRAYDIEARRAQNIQEATTQLEAIAPNVPQPGGQANRAKLALLEGVPPPAAAPAPPAAAAPAAPATTAATAAPPAAAGAQPTVTVAAAPPAGLKLIEDRPGFAPVGQPGRTDLTREEATLASNWLVGNGGRDSRAFLAAHPEARAALAADPAKWIRENLVTGKAKDLYGAKDPLEEAARLRATKPAPSPTGSPIGDAATNAMSTIMGGAGTIGNTVGRSLSTIFPGAAATMIQATKPGFFSNESGDAAATAISAATGLPISKPGATKPGSNQANIAAAQKIEKDAVSLARQMGQIAGTLTKDARHAVAKGNLVAAPDLTTNPQSATDVVPTATAPMSAGAAASVAKGQAPSPHYLAEPDSISPDTQRALVMRQFLVKEIRSMARGATAESSAAAIQLMGKIGEIDNGIAHMQGMKAIQDLRTFGDPRRMQDVMSYQTGVPIQIQMRKDGTYDVARSDTGEIAAKGITLEDLLDRGQSMFDQKYVESKIAADAATATFNREQIGRERIEMLKGDTQLKVQQIQSANSMIQALAVAQENNQGRLVLEEYIRSHPNQTVTMAADGSSVIQLPTGEILSYNENRGTVELNGVTTQLPKVKTLVPAGGGSGAGVSLPGNFPAGQI